MTQEEAWKNLQQKVINDFMAKINYAINVYEKNVKPSFWRKKNISIFFPDRQKDIVLLKSKLSAPMNNFKDYVSLVSSFLRQMETGFLGFETGNSKLKKLLQEVVNFYRDQAFSMYMIAAQNTCHKPDHIVNYPKLIDEFLNNKNRNNKFKESCNTALTETIKINPYVMLGLRR